MYIMDLQSHPLGLSLSLPLSCYVILGKSLHLWASTCAKCRADNHTSLRRLFVRIKGDTVSKALIQHSVSRNYSVIAIYWCSRKTWPPKQKAAAQYWQLKFYTVLYIVLRSWQVLRCQHNHLPKHIRKSVTLPLDQGPHHSGDHCAAQPPVTPADMDAGRTSLRRNLPQSELQQAPEFHREVTR